MVALFTRPRQYVHVTLRHLDSDKSDVLIDYTIDQTKPFLQWAQRRPASSRSKLQHSSGLEYTCSN